MKKGSTVSSSLVEVVGLDLGDRVGVYGVLAMGGGEEVREGRVQMKRAALVREFGRRDRMRVILEAGTHSGWVSRLLLELGHEVFVGNPRRLRMISASGRKSDRFDAWMLARLGRVDVKLLSPVEHRSEELQSSLSVLRSRDALVRARTQLINQVRGTVKVYGERLAQCSAPSFAGRAGSALPALARPALEPVVAVIGELTARIKAYNKQIAQMIATRYQAAAVLQQVSGVGPITALAFVLTVGRPERFTKSRQVGPYLGLVPRRDQSGNRDPQLRITKHGDGHLRWLLVQCAHHILGEFGQDSDLRRYGLRIAGQGGKSAKKRAAVAVARKLAVVLHRLWVTGQKYDPLYQTQRQDLELQVA